MILARALIVLLAALAASAPVCAEECAAVEEKTNAIVVLIGEEVR